MTRYAYNANLSLFLRKMIQCASVNRTLNMRDSKTNVSIKMISMPAHTQYLVVTSARIPHGPNLRIHVLQLDANHRMIKDSALRVLMILYILHSIKIA